MRTVIATTERSPRRSLPRSRSHRGAILAPMVCALSSRSRPPTSLVSGPSPAGAAEIPQPPVEIPLPPDQGRLPTIAPPVPLPPQRSKAGAEPKNPFIQTVMDPSRGAPAESVSGLDRCRARPISTGDRRSSGATFPRSANGIQTPCGTCSIANHVLRPPKGGVCPLGKLDPADNGHRARGEAGPAERKMYRTPTGQAWDSMPVGVPGPRPALLALGDGRHVLAAPAGGTRPAV